MRVFFDEQQKTPEFTLDDEPKWMGKYVEAISPPTLGQIVFQGSFLDATAIEEIAPNEPEINVPSQTCITNDNVTVDIDGLIYLQV